MKTIRLLAVALMFSVPAYAGPTRVVSSSGHIGPGTSASQVVIVAAGAGKRNCLTHLTVISDAAATLTVADGATTIWSLALPASTGYTDDWPDDDAFCGSPNASMTISVSAGTYSINYQGYTY